MSNLIPVPMSKDNLAAVLEDIIERVRTGDSFEGNIEYMMPGPGDPDDADFMVRGTYRIGNSMGQGGMRMIGLVPRPQTTS